MQKFRPDIQNRYSRLLTDDTILNYIYHCNAQKPRYLFNAIYKQDAYKYMYIKTAYCHIFVSELLEFLLEFFFFFGSSFMAGVSIFQLSSHLRPSMISYNII